jgi:hypothetical protein
MPEGLLFLTSFKRVMAPSDVWWLFRSGLPFTFGQGARHVCLVLRFQASDVWWLSDGFFGSFGQGVRLIMYLEVKVLRSVGSIQVHAEKGATLGLLPTPYRAWCTLDRYARKERITNIPIQEETCRWDDFCSFVTTVPTTMTDAPSLKCGQHPNNFFQRQAYLHRSTGWTIDTLYTLKYCSPPCNVKLINLPMSGNLDNYNFYFVDDKGLVKRCMSEN